jgi:hypothetical protein
MTRTRLAAAAIVTFGLLAPVAAATSASAKPVECGQAALAKDFKHAKKAKAVAAHNKGKKKGHAKLTFVHAGTVKSVDAVNGTLSFVVRGGQVKALRGCMITVAVPDTAKVKRGDAAATLADVVVGDHVNVKGTLGKDDAGVVSYTATRVAASAKH